MRAERDRLVTPAFALTTASALAYFIAIGALTPVLPRYVEDSLHGDGLRVGLAVGAFAVSAALLRPATGHIGDRYGRRVLVLGGSVIAAGSILLYGLVDHLLWLILMRLVTGAGEAAVFVGTATTIQDMAPTNRRGEAASYFSVAIYGGLGVGPVLGEAVRSTWNPGTVWLVAAFACGVAAVLGLWVPDTVPARADDDETIKRKVRLLHPDAVGPGVVLALATTGVAGFFTFVPLYVDEVGLGSSGGVFAMYAALVLSVRILGARLPDWLGPMRGTTLALVFSAIGLFLVGAWSTASGLYVGTLVYGCGASLLYPSLFPLVVTNAPESERSQAVATFTLFFDIAQGLGAAVLGLIVALSDERGAFIAASFLSVAALAVLRRQRAAPAAAAGAT